MTKNPSDNTRESLTRLERQVAHLEREIKTYRHAFETTAADCDRWKNRPELLKTQISDANRPQYTKPTPST